MRIVLVVVTGALLAAGLLAIGGSHALGGKSGAQSRYTAVPEGEGADAFDRYWNDRLTYPTGDYNPAWLRAAGREDESIESAVPLSSESWEETNDPTAAATGPGSGAGEASSTSAAQGTLSTTSWTPLGPRPLRMTGCSGCFNYTTTEGRVNAIVVDPTTTTNGSIVAYAASVGGGVWKTTNCCSASTSWSVTTDDNPLISSISIDTLALDPNDHNTIYAGTGDLNYGSFSMGSQGILKSTDAGAHWTVLGAGIFGPAYTEPAGQFPQYDAVGKVRVDPNDSDNVVAGTKKGLFLSYDAGAHWTGPCTTNSFPTQRQDITALELSNVGGVTRILAAVGARGFATTVQFDLGANGANGIYKANLPASGCPSFASTASNANGFVFGTSVTGSPYATGANMNAGSGNPWVSATNGNQVGRVDLAVAPSNPNVVYAQVQSIAPNNNSGGSAGCGNTNGCQLGVWSSVNGGTSWSFMPGSAGGSLRACDNTSGDYPQNWYDQAVAVDPNNPDRVYISTFDVWFATRTGTSFNDVTCGYSFSGSAGPVHVDQHALAFLPGSSSILLLGNDGGVHGSTNANAGTSTVDPTWFNMDTGFNTIEFYSGDISGNFATSASPQANGGAQDNGSMSVTFSGYPTGPAQWQMGRGGDGFYARIDPVGTGTSLRMWQGNNSGSLGRCISNCTASGATWTTKNGGWSADTQSFVLPYDLFHGGIPGGDDCPAAAASGGCGRLLVGSTRVWETINGNAANTTGTVTWVATNNPTNQNMTKQTLGNRSFINQVKYSPKWQSAGIVGTNDGNVWIGRNLGTGVSGGATWTNVTGGNAVLPNRPVLGIALDPSAPAANLQTGYAAVGGFNANTPTTPGHLFRVSCTANCASSTWADKTGNLPDVPVDSVIVNPRFPQQVFAGTDFGIYFTNDITLASPTWYRFDNGLPSVMVWDLQIDRGGTTLSAWTRSRGAYVWRLPDSAVTQSQEITFDPLEDRTFGDPDFTVAASSSSALTVGFSANGNCTVAGTSVHLTGAGSCTITASQAGNLDFDPADSVSRTFAIARAGQTIAFGAINDATFGDADFTISAIATSGLAVTLAVDSGPCTLSASTSPATLHINGTGGCSVRAAQGGNVDYDPAPDEVRMFSISKANQTIAFAPLGDKTYLDPDFSVAATASSGLTVGFVAAGNCTIAGSTVQLTGAGSCTITASQTGDGNYNPAPDVSQSFTINRAGQTVDFAPLPDRTYGDDDFTVNATASSGLAVLFGASGNCTLTGTSVHIDGAGSCTVTASQAGDSNYRPADDVERTFAIHKADQTISFGAINDATFGDADFGIDATATSGLLVSLEVVSGPCTLSSPTSPATVHITGSGTCQVKASREGNDDYNAAPDVVRSFAIGKANQTISFGALATKTFGDPDFTVSATASSGLAVSFTAVGGCTVSGTTVHIVSVGDCTVTASQAGNGDFNPAPDVSRTFAVHWTFAGFFAPIDNLPALNVVTAGSSVPTKFSLGGNRGTGIFAAGSPASVRIDCTTWAPIGSPVQTNTPGSSGLSYSSGEYNQVWKTDKAWAETCRELRVTLVDGTTHSARFRFK